MSNGILDSLDFTNFIICGQGKVLQRRLGANRTSKVLELINIDKLGANRTSKVLELINTDKLGANRASKVLELLSVLRESKERTRGWEPIELQKS